MTIKTHRYFLNNDENYEGWNLVVLDQDGGECTLFASGDYGSYVARFYFGKDFREAFLNFDKEYLLRKIAKDDVYDGDTTLKEIKWRIIQYRQDGSWSREQARKEWDLLNDYDFDYKEQFYEWAQETETYDCYFDAFEIACYKFPAAAVAFVERALPRLKQLIQKELEEEVAA